MHKTIISQYANSPVILAITDNMAEWLRQDVLYGKFIRKIWDIDTAIGVGLDIWGRIVGVTRYLRFPSQTKFFGFDPGYLPFNNAPFFHHTPSTNTYQLSDDYFRKLIKAKAFANINPVTIPNLNKMLAILFDGRNCYVEDLGNMAMNFTFTFALTDIEYGLMVYSGIIPHPAGVTVNVITP